MSHYSIDLGIHPDATGGHEGSFKDPYPLQIALTKGKLLPEDGAGHYTGFEPQALASFSQIKSKDIIIFRVFEISATLGPLLGSRSLQEVKSVDVTFTDLGGSPITQELELWPWKRQGDIVTLSRAPEDQLSLAFTSVPGGMDLPCYFEHGNSDQIVHYHITPPMPKKPTPYLFSVTIETTHWVIDKSETSYHQDDPEMVVSPDEGPGCEETVEDCLPAQVPVSVAMSL